MQLIPHDSEIIFPGIFIYCISSQNPKKTTQNDWNYHPLKLQKQSVFTRSLKYSKQYLSLYNKELTHYFLDILSSFLTDFWIKIHQKFFKKEDSSFFTYVNPFLYYTLTLQMVSVFKDFKIK